MSRILITGGAGFIGSHTADRLLAMGHDVRILDNLQKPVHLKGKPTYLSPDLEFIEGDVRDRSTMLGAMRGVDAIYHLAAYQDYHTDFSNFFHTNAVSTALIYEIIVQEHLNVEKVIVASSQFAQGEGLYRNERGAIISPVMRSEEQLEQRKWELTDPDDGTPLEWIWTPETHAAPANAYALSKHSQEMQALRFGRRYGVPSVALRYSIVQGSRQSFYNAYSGACRIFALHYFFGKAPTIYEDGLQSRDFVNIHDVVDANVLVLDDPRADYEIFSVGGGISHTVTSFADVVATEFERSDIPAIIPGQFRFGDTRHANSDITKLRGLGWEPQRTVKDSVREYAEYLRAQGDIEDILEYAEKMMRLQDVVRTT
jgi:dTDP-L-rhamnose 4-epimerase